MLKFQAKDLFFVTKLNQENFSELSLSLKERDQSEVQFFFRF